MANLITLVRFLLLLVLVALCYSASPWIQLVNMPLVVLVFILDGVDGYVARKRNETTLFGAIFDISIDRVVENVLWLVMVDLGSIPVWVAIVFLARSFVVDSIRSHAASRGETPFGMMQSRLGRFLVASRFMRMSYGVLKAATFGYILMVRPWPGLFPAFYSRWHPLIESVQHLLVGTTVLLCLLRGVPVMWEFWEREIRFRPGVDPKLESGVEHSSSRRRRPPGPAPGGVRSVDGRRPPAAEKPRCRRSPVSAG
ncbi:MAG: CDP-alcohol phosphatidyltransferase family protein [Desulfobacterales bacterium]